MKLMNVLPSFVLVLFLVLKVAAEVQFRHGGEPTNMTVLQGDSAYFRCYIDGLDDNTRLGYRIDWNINGRFLSTRYTYSAHKYSLTTRSVPGRMLLTVHDCHSTDRGYYYCVVYIKGRLHIYSKRGYLTVIQKPSFHHPLASSVTVVEGQSVLLHCHIQNFEVDRFNVSWFRNYVQLSQNYYISNPNVSPSYGNVEIIGRYRQTTAYDLQITNAGKASEGYFHCSVYIGNREILKSRFVRLSVHNPTDKQYSLCTPQTPKIYSVGDALRTTCHSRGWNSQVDFFWIKDGDITPAIQSGDYLVKNEWTLTESDNGTYVWCSIRRPTILDERQCSIGPIRIHNNQASTDNATKAIHNTDKISSPLISSEATLSVTTTLTRMATSQAQTRTLHFDAKPSKVTGNHLTYILTVLIGILIVVVVTITVVCVRSKKSGVRVNVGEATNQPKIMNEYESCRVINTGVEDTVHYDVLQRIVTSDLNLRSAETMDVESSFSSETRPNDDVTVVTADVTYASVCKREVNTTNTTDYDKLSFPCSGNGSGNHRSKGDKKSRNVEGLVYAELDLQQSDSLARTAASTLRREEPSVIYSELKHPK